jgi:hypothetical protein
LSNKRGFLLNNSSVGLAGSLAASYKAICAPGGERRRVFFLIVRLVFDDFVLFAAGAFLAADGAAASKRRSRVETAADCCDEGRSSRGLRPGMARATRRKRKGMLSRFC